MKIKDLINDVERALGNLDVYVEYEINGYHEDNTTIVDVNFNYDECEDDWDEQVEDAISDVAFDWSGTYSWDGSCISVSVKDGDNE